MIFKNFSENLLKGWKILAGIVPNSIVEPYT